MVEIVYLPNKNMPEKTTIRWDGVDYSLSKGKPIEFNKEVAKVILGDWNKEGILLVEERARVKETITSSTPFHRIFAVIDNKYKNIFEEIEIENEDENLSTDNTIDKLTQVNLQTRKISATEIPVRNNKKMVKRVTVVKKNKIKNND